MQQRPSLLKRTKQERNTKEMANTTTMDQETRINTTTRFSTLLSAAIAKNENETKIQLELQTTKTTEPSRHRYVSTGVVANARKKMYHLNQNLRMLRLNL